MRIGIKFRAQHDEDAVTVARFVSERSQVTGLTYTKQDDVWLLTSAIHFSTLIKADDHLERARVALTQHTGVEGKEFVQERPGENFIPLIEFAKTKLGYHPVRHSPAFDRSFSM